MAIVRPIIDEALWTKWVASRPPFVQEIVRKYPPDRLYLLKSTNQRVTIHSYLEDGTVQVDVTGDYNPGLVFARRVFGITPADLEECELPPK